MPRTSIGRTVGDWIKLMTLVSQETVTGSPALSVARTKLEASLEEINRLILERDRLEARKQEVTRLINELQEAGRIHASFLRTGLRFELGKSNEGLVAFGIKPFRGRKRSRKPPSPDAVSPDGQGEADPSSSGSAAE